jgi:hypothetical protein
MSETTVNTSVCSKCSAEIREGSLFCYNCGTSVSVVGTSDASVETEHEALASTAETVDRQPPVAGPGRKLRSAADIGRKRAFNRQPIEVTWTPRNDAVNSFVVTGLIIVTLTVLLVIAALYYR